MIQNLKQLRKDKGISQQALADIILVSQQSVNKYENHSVEPDIKTLIKIADYFEVSLDYLTGRSKNKEMAATMQMSDLNPTESKLIQDFRALNVTQKNCIQTLINSYEEHRQ